MKNRYFSVLQACKLLNDEIEKIEPDSNFRYSPENIENNVAVDAVANILEQISYDLENGTDLENYYLPEAQSPFQELLDMDGTDSEFLEAIKNTTINILCPNNDQLARFICQEVGAQWRETPVRSLFNTDKLLEPEVANKPWTDMANVFKSWITRRLNDPHST